MRIAFAGTPEFALPALRALASSGHELVGVLTQPDRPSGRGRHPAASPIKQAAQADGLAISQPSALRTAEERADLESWQPELLVVVAYGLILPAEVLALPRMGCINVHASLLPRWRGAAPIQRALLGGDTTTGISIMLMDAGLDTGAILLQRSLPIDALATSGSLHVRLAELGATALLEVVRQLQAGSAEPRPQSRDGITYAPKIEKAEALIDWRRAATQIERQVRAFNPRPVAETRLEGEQVRIFAAQVETSAPRTPAAAVADGGAPGTILAVHPDGIVVRCGEGALAIREVQRSGRKRVSAREFAQALALAPGQSFD
ncbi:MAG TPA: methionyl-tRNA formyltransferase [Steroidobacteraceae bacterium]|nr:methionyl-tRNA formyltransferase [Steroidobacteraceae bacterium]